MLSVLELFSGTGSLTKEFKDSGDNVVSVELDTQFEATLHEDILKVTSEQLLDLLGGSPDFIWASPPCTSMSTGSFRHHWQCTTPCLNCEDTLTRVSGEVWEHTLFVNEISCKPRVSKDNNIYIYLKVI